MRHSLILSTLEWGCFHYANSPTHQNHHRKITDNNNSFPTQRKTPVCMKQSHVRGQSSNAIPVFLLLVACGVDELANF